MSLLADYHLHTTQSPDGRSTLEEQIQAAIQLGLEEICVTDHTEYDLFLGSDRWQQNFEKSRQAFEKAQARFPQFKVRYGYELGLPNSEESRALFRASVPKEGVDFVIASAHMVDGVDVFSPEWYAGRTFPEACSDYLKSILRLVSFLKDGEYDVIGHINCPTKVPTTITGQSDPRIRLEWIEEAFDALARHCAEHDKSMELNTSAWRMIGDRPPLEVHWLRRLRETGVEWLTFGSDAHQADRLGYRFAQAREVAIEAGFRYYAVFKDRQRTLLPL